MSSRQFCKGLACWDGDDWEGLAGIFFIAIILDCFACESLGYTRMVTENYDSCDNRVLSATSERGPFVLRRKGKAVLELLPCGKGEFLWWLVFIVFSIRYRGRFGNGAWRMENGDVHALSRTWWHENT
jgi:hypothetical protein